MELNGPRVVVLVDVHDHRARARPNISARVFYNLACLFSTALGAQRRRRGFEERVDELADWAFDNLEEGLKGIEGGERDQIVSWARIDPSLKALRIEREDDFFALLGTYTSPQIPTPKAP